MKSYLTLTAKQKTFSRCSKRYTVLDKLIRVAAGSQKLEVQVELLHDRLKHIHKHYNRYSYTNLSNFVRKLPELEKFRNSEDQKMINRYKYPIVVELVNKLCGVSSKEHGAQDIRYKFLQSCFPSLLKLTWSKLLDPGN